MLVVVALTATVPVLVLVTVSAGHVEWLAWVAVPAGVATGVVLAVYLALRRRSRPDIELPWVLCALAEPVAPLTQPRAPPGEETTCPVRYDHKANRP